MKRQGPPTTSARCFRGRLTVPVRSFPVPTGRVGIQEIMSLFRAWMVQLRKERQAAAICRERRRGKPGSKSNQQRCGGLRVPGAAVPITSPISTRGEEMKSSNTSWLSLNFASKAAPSVLLLLGFLMAMSAAPAYAQKLVAQTNSNTSYYLDANGVLYAWGNNQYGQLDNGTTTNDSVASKVPFPTGVTSWSQVAGGDTYVLALGNNGVLYAWGNNSSGQLGNGTTTSSTTPVEVTMPSGVTSWKSIAAGAGHSLAVGNNGMVYAWGLNNKGQLGDSSTTSSDTLVAMRMPAGETASEVIAGNNHSLVLCTDGRLYAVGNNFGGQLGDNTTTASDTLVEVQFPSGVTSWKTVAAGAYFSLAIGSDGNLYAWGQGNSGQIGNGATSNALVPTLAPMPSGVTGWTSIAGGASFMLAVANNGMIYGAGYDGNSELGNNNNIKSDTLTPAVMPATVTGFTSIAAGHNNGLAIAKDGRLYAWGENQYGQVGDGTTNKALIPTLVNVSGLSVPALATPANGSGMTVGSTSLAWSSASGATSYELQISTVNSFTNDVVDTAGISGTSFSVGKYLGPVLTLGTTYYWRIAATDAMGGAYSSAWTFSTPGSPDTAGTRLAAQTNSSSSYFINRNDSLFAWGNNQYGQLGGTPSSVDSVASAIPFPSGVTEWLQVAGGQNHTVALGNDGNIYEWGQNNDGQLGNGTTTNSSTPVTVPMPAGVTYWKAIAAGAAHTVAIGSNDTVYAWGQNSFGELGNGTKTQSGSPVVASLPAGVKPVQVFAGNNWTMVLASNGALYATGRNANGQLGNGTSTDSDTLAMVNFPTGVTGWLDFAGGGYHAAAIGNDGNLYTWGSGGNGQLADGGTSNVTSPAKVSMPAGVSGWEAIACGENFTEAVGNDGNLYEAGYSGDGETGNGTHLGTLSTLTIANMPGGASKYVDVSAGHNHVIAVAGNGSLYAWGKNSNGQLGNYYTSNSYVPVLVNMTGQSIPMLSAPVAGTTLSTADTALAWMTAPGAFRYQLQVATDSSFSNIVLDSTQLTGTYFLIHSLIGPTFNLQTKYYWRMSEYNGTSTSMYSDVLSFMTPGPPALTNPSLAAETNSNSSYYINAKDTLFAWGNNQYGQLGDGTMTNDSFAVKIPFPSGVTGWMQVAGGQGHTVALGNDGNVYTWGYNSNGQLGIGTTANSAMPVKVAMPSGVTKWTSVAAGALHTVAVGNDGNVYAWGQNNFGELGNASTTDAGTPVKMKLPAGLTPMRAYAGNNCSLVLFSNGALYATGRNGNGQLGNNTKTDSDTLVEVQFPTDVTAWTDVAAGGYHVAAIGNDGNLYAWGSDGNGQVANYTTTSAVLLPTMVTMPAGVTGWEAVACGENFTEAIASDGNIYEAGYSGDGETGNGNTYHSLDTLKAANMPSGVTKYLNVAAGHNHVIAIAQNDSLYAWGANSSGQLGNDSTTNSYVPVKVLFGALPGPVVLAVPTIVGPTSGDTLAVSDTALVWMSVPNATAYLVQIASDSAFTNVVVDSLDKGDTSLVIEKMLGTTLLPQTKYFWRIEAWNTSTASAYSAVWSFITPTLTAIQNRGGGLPKTFALMQNYPNPFNPTTIIKYDLPSAQFVMLNVYNVLGQRVASLVDGRQSAGYYEVNFNADRYASGVYFYVLRAGHFTATHKMMLLK